MEKETSIVVNEKRKLEAEIVLYSGNPEINKELEKVQTLQKSDFYTIGQGNQAKTVPSARALQWLANRKNIKTRIMEVQSTKEYCRATVCAWIGNNPIPESNAFYKEATCEMIFEIELAEKVLELIYKENKYRDNYRKEPLKQGKDWIINDRGMPIFTDENMQSKMMREMLRMRKYALRTVVTKAERIIHSKLADVEWRDEDELEDEIHEVELVADKKISPIVERAAEPLSVRDNPAPVIDTDTEVDAKVDKPKPPRKPRNSPKTQASPERVAGVPPKDERPKNLMFKPDIIRDTPFATFEAILARAMELEIGHLVTPIINDVYPQFSDDGMDIEDVPDAELIRIIERLTGVRMEAA